MAEPAQASDPSFDEIAPALELASLLATTSRTTRAVRTVYAQVIERSKSGGMQIVSLHLVFIALAEAVASEIGEDTLPGYDTFDNTKKRAAGNRNVDTLTIFVPSDGGKEKQIGIRRFANRAIEVFRGRPLLRTGFPSSPAHQTGRWEDFTGTLDAIFAMTRGERRALAELLYGEVLKLDKSLPRVAPRTVQNPFVQVIDDFPRAALRGSGENSGAALQGIAYGYVVADAPELTPRSASVRTGARRAGLVGDIDGYNGPFLQLAVEVKDRHIDDFADTLTDFVSNLADHPDTTAYVICTTVDDDVRDECEKYAISVLTLDEMAELVRLWTASKQTRAVREALAYYQQIERSPALTNRFSAFLEGVSD